MAMAHTHGRFVWYELMTTDMAAAESFYRDVVGWGAQDAGMADVRYTMFTVEGRPVTGSMALPESARSMGIPPLWLGYIAVDDVDTLAADIVIDGGVVHRAAADIPGIGRFAIVGDPQGAAFALYKGTSNDPPPAPMDAPGHVGWHELHAEDGDAAFDFYSRAFGWAQNSTFDMGATGAYRIFGLDGQDMGGMMTKPENMPMPSWIFYFNVPAIDAAADRVRTGGGLILNGPTEVPGGSWVIQCLDPQGAMFALTAPER
jgi:predicted enzyme related to lactoylglutathione lyase